MTWSILRCFVTLVPFLSSLNVTTLMIPKTLASVELKCFAFEASAIFLVSDANTSFISSDIDLYVLLRQIINRRYSDILAAIMVYVLTSSIIYLPEEISTLKYLKHINLLYNFVIDHQLHQIGCFSLFN